MRVFRCELFPHSRVEDSDLRCHIAGVAFRKAKAAFAAARPVRAIEGRSVELCVALLEDHMIRIESEEKFVNLNRAIHVWARRLGDGTTEDDLFNDVSDALRKGCLDGAEDPLLLFERATSRIVLPKGPYNQLWPYLPAIRNDLYLSAAAAAELALLWNRPVLSPCSNATKNPIQPGPSPELRDAPIALVREKIRFVCESAAAAGKFGRNINELPDDVMPLLKQDGFKTSKNLIKEIGSELEFRRYRRPRGRTIASEQRRKLAADFQLSTSDKSGNLDR
jgi:hypothetical protein